MSKDALNRAIKIAGNQEVLGAMIGKSQQTISYWLTDLEKTPAEFVLPIEKALNGQVTRHELRPDIYPIEQ